MDLGSMGGNPCTSGTNGSLGLKGLWNIRGSFHFVRLSFSCAVVGRFALDSSWELRFVRPVAGRLSLREDRISDQLAKKVT